MSRVERAAEECMRLLRFLVVFSLSLLAPAALSADASNGPRIAETRCATCHAIVPSLRRDVADAPPFEAIARKFAGNREMLTFSILDPHPRMNVTLTRPEAEDVAAFIRSEERRGG